MRKKKNEKEKKISKIIRFQPDEYVKVAEHIKERGLTFTGFVKALIRKAI